MLEHGGRGPLGDLLALQLGQRREQREDEPAHRRTGVDVLLNHGEVRAGRTEPLGQIDCILGTSGQPGERIDAKHGLPLAAAVIAFWSPGRLTARSPDKSLSWYSATTL